MKYMILKTQEPPPLCYMRGSKLRRSIEGGFRKSQSPAFNNRVNMFNRSNIHGCLQKKTTPLPATMNRRWTAVGLGTQVSYGQRKGSNGCHHNLSKITPRISESLESVLLIILIPFLVDNGTTGQRTINLELVATACMQCIQS